MNSVDTIDLSVASQIYFNLLKTGELSDKSNLYTIYLNNEKVRNALEVICDSSNVKVITMSNYLYMIPGMDNDIIGFDHRKEPLFNGSLKDEYLTYLIMALIFSEFTSEYCPTSYISVVDIVDMVTESLERSADRQDIQEMEDRYAFNILTLKSYWGSKAHWEEKKRKSRGKKGEESLSRDYKIGYIRRTVRFLEKEGLITHIKQEDKIVATDRFKNLMHGNFLDEDRKAEIEYIMSLGKGGKDNAENK
ncbi:MAG: DUF6063 family protein [Clostridium sp.]